MATVTGYTAARMKQIEDSAIIDGEVVGNNLILEPKGFDTDPVTYPKIDAGNVRGPVGPQGAPGEVTNASLAAALLTLLPPGAITMWAGAAAPATWALCDGGESNRTGDAALFAAIGTTYGAGNGTTTFNRPNFQSKFPAGKGTAAWSDALNDQGGSKDAVLIKHKHTTPVHQHSTPAHGHSITEKHRHPYNHGHAITVVGASADHGHNLVINPGGTHAHSATADGAPLWYQGGPGNLGMVSAGTGHSGAPSNLYEAWRPTGPADNHVHSAILASGAASHNHTASTDPVYTLNGEDNSTNYSTRSDGGAGVTPSTEGAGETNEPGVVGTDLNLPPFITVNFIIKL